jgi:hypothetical protein
MLSENWESLRTLIGKEGGNNVLAVINGASHMAFTDLPMLLMLELRLCFFTPSFA